LNGRINGVVNKTLIGENIIAKILGTLLSCASNIAIELFVSMAFCSISFASFGLKWCNDKN
jgi:hypothetical protein